tara:strand:+ start:235 stop:621 length:387 start_codon:yes stop_codon:yes gene_type:complete
MATHTGVNGVVKLGSNTIGEVTAFTLNQTHDTVEDTALSDSNKSYKALRGDATATVECHFDETDTAQEAANSGVSATLELYPEGADSGDKYFVGTAIVTGADVGVTMDGIISRTLSFQFTGGITEATV